MSHQDVDIYLSDCADEEDPYPVARRVTMKLSMRERLTAKLQKPRRISSDVLFILLTFVGILCGITTGLSVRLVQPGEDALLWIGLPGELYLRILNAAILPVIVCSVIDGTASNDPKSSGRIGMFTFIFLVFANVIATLFGVAFTVIIKPGSGGVENVHLIKQNGAMRTMDIFADFFRNTFTDNIVGAGIRQAQTKYDKEEVTREVNISGHLTNQTTVERSRSLGYINGPNIIGVVVVSTAAGMAAAQLGERSRAFVEVLKATYCIIMQIFQWIKWTGPVGVASLIAKALAETENLKAALSAIGMFLLTVFAANLAYLAVVILPVLYCFTRQSPFTFVRSITKPMVMAYGPSSIVAALPDMIKVSVYTFEIDSRVATVVLPLCTVLNHDASGLFMAVTCISISQFAGVDSDVSLFLNTVVLTIVSTFAVPDMPSASIVAVLVILKTVGIPPINIGLILAVDWFADRFRAVCNVASDMVGVNVVWALCRASLPAPPPTAIVKVVPDPASDMI